MPEFLRLSTEEQADILSGMSVKLGRSAQVLQKDVWVCWALKELFGTQRGVRMAFKGGTSLSKVFQAIHRFSEDVDVSLDYRDLQSNPEFDPFGEGISKSKRKQFSERLKECVRDHIHQVLMPPISSSFIELTAGEGQVEISEDGERVRLLYPSGLGVGAAYLGDWILLEFGGRNVTEPNGPHRIDPAIAAELPSLRFPEAEVMVLAPERTFWEKATLIHVLCHRQGDFGAERISRHFYDLVMLYRRDIGVRALADRALLHDVVRHKKVFFDAGYANYDACLVRGFRLVPEEPLLAQLRQDYTAMDSSGMFDVPPPSFSEILDALKEIESTING
jgi:hypothetical protein